MWIVKGTLLAFWLFGFGTIGFLYVALYRHLAPNTAVGVSVFAAYTIHNPFWWLSLVACFVLGHGIAHSLVVPLGVWIAFR